MDKRKIILIKIILTITVLLSLFDVTWAQCPKDRIEVIEDSCTLVVMSPEKFAYYYQIDKQMALVRDSLPKLVKNIERERKGSDKVIENLESTISELDKEKILIETHCENEITKLKVDNFKLEKKVRLEKKKKWLYLSVATIVYLLTAIR